MNSTASFRSRSARMVPPLPWFARVTFAVWGSRRAMGLLPHTQMDAALALA